MYIHTETIDATDYTLGEWEKKEATIEGMDYSCECPAYQVNVARTDDGKAWVFGVSSKRAWPYSYLETFRRRIVIPGGFDTAAAAREAAEAWVVQRGEDMRQLQLFAHSMTTADHNTSTHWALGRYFLENRATVGPLLTAILAGKPY